MTFKQLVQKNLQVNAHLVFTVSFTRILLCHSFNFNPCHANIPIYLVLSSTLPAFSAEYTKQRNTSSKSTIEKPEKGLKYIQRC